ncbi:MAG: neuromedin U [Candidatus Eremiobacteraeota bacterium]|nr:neuromedin U [Candidatus Eremiobacteraeota bacterium]
MRLLAISLIVGAVAFSAGRASAFAQAEASPSPSPTASASPSVAPGMSGLGNLTPAQQEAVKLAIIKTSQNPVGNITVVPFQNNFNYGYGPYTRFQYNLNVQPVIPIMLAPNMNLIARTIIPIVNQPSSAPPGLCASPSGCPSTFGLSDVQEQLFFAPKTKPGALIWGIGPIFQFPTSTPASLGSGKWSAGPNAVALLMPGKWVLGALVTQLWSVAGPSNRANVNAFLIQPFVNYNLPNGWALSTAPIITANWAAPSNKWAVPLGGGVARTFEADKQLMSLSVLYYSYITRPLNSPQTTLRVAWALLWPVKRGIDIQELIQEAK